MKQNVQKRAIHCWSSLCATLLAASLMAACGGGGDGGVAVDSGGSVGTDETVVTPLAPRQPGEHFALETPLLAGGSQTSYYVVHGVTPDGELVDSARPGLVDGVRVPVLESVTRDGQSSATAANEQSEPPTFVDSITLKKRQLAFYQQLWDAMAEHEGTRDPQAILAEIDDLDGRVVDLMDDVAASGVSLPDYLDFYDRLDVMPEFADKQLAELNLREALSSVDQASTFDEDPPACSAGLERVVSQSGLSSFCRVPSNRTTTTMGEPRVAPLEEVGDSLAALTEPNLKGMMAVATSDLDLETLILRLQIQRTDALEEALKAEIEKVKQAQHQREELERALRENGRDTLRWKSYCAQHPELACANVEPDSLAEMMISTLNGKLDSTDTASQLDQLRLQALMARRNEAFEMVSTFMKKMLDARASIISNMR